MIKSKIYYNYEYKNKFLGIIDYKALVIFCTIIFTILGITSLFNLSYKISFIIIAIFIPIGLVFLFCGNNNESGIDVMLNVVRFYRKSNIYIYKYNEIRKSDFKNGKLYKKMCK